jgi:Relaxase/Mobilisation nuclease domain
MTADQVKGKGFRGALIYNLEKLEKSLAIVLDTSFSVVKEQPIMREIALVKMLRPNLSKYFYHTSINFPPKEDLADDKIKKIALEYLQGMGFEQHQYILFRHFDADHPHVHLLVNRIGYDGSVVSDSKDYYRSEQVLRKLERRYGLTQVISSRQALERAMTKNELEMMKRTDEPSVKMKLQVLLQGLMKEKLTMDQFISRLESRGINVLFNQAGTGFVSGISYGYEGMQFKGAHLGRAYKWQAIKNRISYEQERDRTAIYQANIRTRARQSGREKNGTGTTGSTGYRAIEDAAERDTVALQQGTGQLQEQIRTANRNDCRQVSKNRPSGHQPIPRDQGDDGQSRSVRPTAKPDIGTMGHQALPDLHIGRVLLGADDVADRMDENALKQFEKKKKKQKKQLKI